MTEIALALAMAFFSIMVLTMISMGVGKGEGPAVIGAVLAPPAAESTEAAVVKPQTDDVIIVYYGGRYHDRDLKPMDPANVNTTGRVLLALDPALPMSEAIQARGRINVENLVVSTLDDRWLTTLRSK